MCVYVCVYVCVCVCVCVCMCVCNNMSFREHYNYICKKAHGLCAMIFRAFETRHMRFLIDLFRIYVRPVLGYASRVWCPHLKVDITLIEKVQRMFTKRVPYLRHLTLDKRLSSNKLESLEHRRLYLDLVLFIKLYMAL